MNFIQTPNIPSSGVRLALADGRIPIELEEGLAREGVRLIRTEKHPDLSEPVAAHPDMIFHHVGGSRMVVAPGTGAGVLRQLEEEGFELVQGVKKLSPAYPGDIAYNGARVGKFFFHHLKYTDEILLQELTAAGVEPVHVRQGYGKCAVAVVDENSFITSDAGIARAAADKGMEVLLIPPQKRICLPGMEYGFIGGCSGMTDSHRWSVFGDAVRLEAFSEIQAFLERKQIAPVSLSDGQIVDFGSLLPLKT